MRMRPAVVMARPQLSRMYVYVVRNKTQLHMHTWRFASWGRHPGGDASRWSSLDPDADERIKPQQRLSRYRHRGRGREMWHPRLRPHASSKPGQARRFRLAIAASGERVVRSQYVDPQDHRRRNPKRTRTWRTRISCRSPVCTTAVRIDARPAPPSVLQRPTSLISGFDGVVHAMNRM